MIIFNSIVLKFKMLLLIFSASFLVSCVFSGEFEYSGNYPELYSVAVNSMLGIRGVQVVGGLNGTINPNISVLEEDNYGRTLFSYSEGSFFGSPSRLIMQKVEGDYVYFYPHYNFILSSGKHRTQFVDKEIETLKKVNSWNQKMSDSSKFVRVKITRQKENGNVSNNKLSDVFHDIFPNINVNLSRPRNEASQMVFLRTDIYGRGVYLGIGHGSEWIGTHIVVLFQPNHSFDIETGVLEITDRFNYQTELRLFMEANGWDTPFEE